MSNKIILSHEDKASKLWKKLNDHWHARLERLRVLLETCEDDRQSALYRGQIFQLKENLNLNKEVKEVESEAPH